MAYFTSSKSSILENNFLAFVLHNAETFNPQVFSYAVDSMFTDEDSLEATINQVDNNYKILLKEKENLVNYAEEWLKTWATNRNNYYSGEHSMLYQIKRSIRSTEKICQKYAKRFTAKAKYEYDVHKKEQPSVFHRSQLFVSTYPLSMYGDDCLTQIYPDIVNKTYKVLKQFFDLLVECLVICCDTIAKEQKIANDMGACGYLFDKQTKIITDEISDVLSHISGGVFQIQNENNPLFEKSEKGLVLVENPSSLYHQCTVSDLLEYVSFKVWQEIVEVHASELERKLFKGNLRAVPFARKILTNFDNYIPESRRKKIDSKYIALFIKYFQISEVKDGWRYFNMLYNGDYEEVSYNSVQMAHKKLPDNISNYEFIKNIEKAKKQKEAA